MDIKKTCGVALATPFTILFTLLLLLSINNCFSQIIIQGKVLDKLTNETLIAAHCNLNNEATITNNVGHFRLTASKGNNVLRISYVGYLDEIQNFEIDKDTFVTVFLTPNDKVLDVVNVRAEQSVHEQTIMGRNVLSVEQLSNIPSGFGEPDLMKAITTLPGISTGREGRSNFFVRGGDRGQNLILLDNAKLYNTNHFGGFVSLFNSNVLKHVEVYKGGFPARFGGRASSVVDVYTRDGNKERIKGKFTLGLLSSGGTIEGPIGEKTTFLFGGRTSYFDLFTLKNKRDLKIYGAGNYINFRFYDINFKITHHLTEKSKVYFSFFSGMDSLEELNKSRGSTGNSSLHNQYNVYNNCLSVGVTTAITSKIYWHNTLIFTKYNNALSIVENSNKSGNVTLFEKASTNSIAEINYKSMFNYYLNQFNNFNLGVEFSNYQLNPGFESGISSNNSTGFELLFENKQNFLQQANELSFYIDDELKFNNFLFANIGIRQTMFFTSDKNYARFEPRISLRALLNENVSFKANYTVVNQFNHVVNSNYAIFEKELWLTSSRKIPPQKAKQASIGLFVSSANKKIELTLEGYYKYMTDLIEYAEIPGSDFSEEKIDYNEIITAGGQGEAYGGEFSSKYNSGQFSATLNYVLAWNFRQFEHINNGKWYPFLYDRRHEFSVLGSYDLNKKYTFNANFIFSTGTPFTLPDAYVKMDNYFWDYFAYSGINNRRLPNYHRLDVSILRKTKTKKGRIQTFSLNIFNAYAHKNPTIVYYESSTGKVFKKSMFSVIPSFNYTIEFN